MQYSLDTGLGSVDLDLGALVADVAGSRQKFW